MSQFYYLEGDKIKKQGKEVYLRGVNFGNWLLLEHFMLGLPSVESKIHQSIEEKWGKEFHRQFFRSYQDNYITEDDFAFLADFGFNFIRVPFHYHWTEEAPWQSEKPSRFFEVIDRILPFARKYQLPLMLDLHAAPGAQAPDWNADNTDGTMRFWEQAELRKASVKIWQQISAYYKDEEMIFGYDLLNEPLAEDDSILCDFYADCISAIRNNADQHIIVLEGNEWGKRPDSLRPSLFADEQVMYQPHFYAQLYFPLPKLTDYPCILEDGRHLDKEALLKVMSSTVSHQIKRPALFGETGVKPKKTNQAGYQVYDDVFSLLAEKGWHWSVWTYKDTRGMGFLNPAEDTAWIKFLDRKDIQEKRQQFDDLMRFVFTPWEKPGNLYFQLESLFSNVDSGKIMNSLREARRDLEEIELDYMLNIMYSYSKEEILEMAASFHFKKCVQVPESIKMLKRALLQAYPEPIN